MPNMTALALPSKATAFPMVIIPPPKTQMPTFYELSQDVFQSQHHVGGVSLSSTQKAILKAHQQTMKALLETLNPLPAQLPPVYEQEEKLSSEPYSEPYNDDSFSSSCPVGMMMPPTFPKEYATPALSPLNSSLQIGEERENQKKIIELLMQNQLTAEKRPMETPKTELQTVKKTTRLKKAMAALTLAGLGGLTVFTLVKTPRKELGTILLNASTFAVTENLMENAFRVLI